MPRPIDADVLYKKFLHLYETDKKATGANAYDLCAMLTEDAPTIDAVPVVRCKDCKYWESKNIFGAPYGICTLLIVDMKMKDYCSYGERRCDNDP